MHSNIHNRSRRIAARRTAFTLIEVLLVLAIMVVIFAMVVPNLLGRQDSAMKSTTMISIKSLENTAKQYATEHKGRFPTELNMLLEPKDDDGKPEKSYLDEIPKDAWEQPLFYEYPTTKFGNKNIDRPAIWSAGKDGKNDDGANDDINNWDELLNEKS